MTPTEVEPARDVSWGSVPGPGTMLRPLDGIAVDEVPPSTAKVKVSTGIEVAPNVLLDVMTEDPQWSGEILAECAESSALAIDPLICAEVSSAQPRSGAFPHILSGARDHRSVSEFGWHGPRRTDE